LHVVVGILQAEVLHNENLTVDRRNVVSELVLVLVYKRGSLLSVWREKKRDRAGGVGAREQIGVDRI
jgi:hypothetical protein